MLHPSLLPYASLSGLDENGRPLTRFLICKFPEKRYWVLATLAEAQIGLEDEALGQQRLEEAFAVAPEEWMKQSTQEQVTKLKALLTASPLRSFPRVVTL